MNHFVKKIVLVLLTLAIGISLGIWQIKPPAADEGQPAYQSMMRNIEKLAARPHYSGSEEIKRVRAEIIAEIEGMGLVPTIDKATFDKAEIDSAMKRLIKSEYDWPFEIMGDNDEVEIQNIFVKLEAPGAEKTIMLVSHYDGADCPAAGDCMAGVCAILEAMRAQAQNQNLKNNIYFLLTDGEEFANLGSLTFLDTHPEYKGKIDMVVNFEAQGNSGGLAVFETAPRTYNIMSVYRKAVSRPIGFSMAQLPYELLDTWTDFSFFRQYGYEGINMAISEGPENYHQPTDTFENLNRNAAGHFLSTAMGIADYAANNSLGELSGESADAVYFPFLPGVLVLLTSTWAYILCGVACALAVALLVYRHRHSRRRQRGALAFSILIIALAALSIACAILYNAASYMFWAPLLALAVSGFLKRPAGDKTGSEGGRPEMDRAGDSEKWHAANTIGKMVTGVVALLIWVPVLFLVVMIFSAPV